MNEEINKFGLSKNQSGFWAIQKPSDQEVTGIA